MAGGSGFSLFLQKAGVLLGFSHLLHRGDPGWSLRGSDHLLLRGRRFFDVAATGHWMEWSGGRLKSRAERKVHLSTCKRCRNSLKQPRTSRILAAHVCLLLNRCSPTQKWDSLQEFLSDQSVVFNVLAKRSMRQKDQAKGLVHLNQKWSKLDLWPVFISGQDEGPPIRSQLRTATKSLRIGSIHLGE